MNESISDSNIEKSKWVFYPDDFLKIIWDLIGFFFIIYQAVLVPYRICFDVAAIGGIAIFELTQDFFFLTLAFIHVNVARIVELIF